jgi:hypothetical protein
MIIAMSPSTLAGPDVVDDVRTYKSVADLIAFA